MKKIEMPKLRIGDLVAKIPIIQGGMGVGISLSKLASAVANEGGIGIIATAGIGKIDPDYKNSYHQANKRALVKEIRKARAQTKGIIGVNIMMANADLKELLLASVEEEVDLVILSAGLPLKLPGSLPLGDGSKEIKTKFAIKVSSARAARLIFRYWAKHYNQLPDAVLVEGPMAGGHLGFHAEEIDNPNFALEKLLPGVIAVATEYGQRFERDIPVIAAGGIYTGEDIHKILSLGAQAVAMGTRFVATNECDAHESFKDSYIQCEKEDLIIINSPVGLPGRAIRNKLLTDVASGLRKPYRCLWQCLKTCDVNHAPYCIAIALANAMNGNLEDGFAFAGANAYRIDKLMTVKALIETLANEYAEAAERTAAALLQNSQVSSTCG